MKNGAKAPASVTVARAAAIDARSAGAALAEAGAALGMRLRPPMYFESGDLQ